MNKLNFISHLRPLPPHTHHIIFTTTPLLMNDVYTVRRSTIVWILENTGSSYSSLSQIFFISCDLFYVNCLSILFICFDILFYTTFYLF